MKRAIKTCLALSFILLFMSFSQTARAASLNIGGTVWYAWWDNGLKNYDAGKDLPFDTNNKYYMPSAPMYGPSLGLNIGKWSITAVFLPGNQFKARSSYIDLYDRTKTQSVVHSMLTYDFDGAVSYSFTQWFKLFLGVKVQGYNENGKDQTLGIGFYDSGIYRIDYLALGPGLGIGINAHLVDNLFLLANASGLYLRSESKNFSKGAGIDKISNDVYFTKVRDTTTANIAALNSSVALAYYVEKASLSISVGGRYQFFRYYFAKHSISNYYNYSIYDGMIFDRDQFILNRHVRHREFNRYYDHFYGATFSVVYSVNLTPRLD